MRAESVDVGDALSENAVLFAMRVFASGWVCAVVKHGVPPSEDGHWISWGDDFDLHFFSEDEVWNCVRYPVVDGKTNANEPVLLFSSSLERTESR